MDHRDSWYDRLFDAIPPLPRWFLPVFTLAMLFVLGMILGYALCANRQIAQRTKPLATSVPEDRLQSIDQRLGSVEQRLQA
jgi:hypothetical protein